MFKFIVSESCICRLVTILGYNHTGTAKEVTQLPDVSPQSRALISGRSKGTGHGDLRIYTDRWIDDRRGRDTAGKGMGRKKIPHYAHPKSLT